MNGQINIRTLLLRFYDPGKPERVGISDRSVDFMAEEISIIDANLRDICLKRPDIGFLTDRLMRIKTAADNGGKIFNGSNVVLRSKKMGNHGLKIKPLVRCASYGAVIKVKSIYIDICAIWLHKKSRGHFRSPAPRVETS